MQFTLEMIKPRKLASTVSSGRKDNNASSLHWKRGCVVFAFCLVTAISSPATTKFSTLAKFRNRNGASPSFSPLIQGSDGTFYGTTANGGKHWCGSVRCGTVFKISPTGKLTVLHSFCSKRRCEDGAEPLGGLVRAKDGSFYGTTYGGGTYSSGTVFKITRTGKLTTLYSFCDEFCSYRDGGGPNGTLVQATDGNFYGTTKYSSGIHGTVFEVTPTGQETVLHFFGGSDGSEPAAGLVQGTDGDLYGTTSDGGEKQGTVFKITLDGVLTTLYNFCTQNGCTDGASPYAGLIQAADGNFYGTAIYGGAYGGGVAFKITPDGTMTTIYGFCARKLCRDGGEPWAGLIQATDGNFYGTTRFYGGHCYGGGCGTVFKITPSGKLSTLHRFDQVDGANPTSSLVQATNRALYGTTMQGGVGCGSDGCGTVFRLRVGGSRAFFGR